jgi:UDP-N-acetylmuramoylalanine--D-glutamate ligase
VILVAGGRSKGIDLSPLLKATPRLDGLVAVGEATGELTTLFEGKIPVRTASSIEGAVEAALALAPPGGTVLLAPACSSQDMFRDYAERGLRFAAAVRRLARQRSTPDHEVADA